jgi:biotin-(acetyl-CoA carboxylase) ligase
LKKPKWNDDLSKYIKDFNLDNYQSHYLNKLNEYEPLFEMKPKKDILDKNYQKKRLSPEDRAQFARERRAVEGSIISQKGFEGALVLEHIRGSQYLIRMPDGTEIFASHKKQRGENQSVSTGGWRPWDSDRYV